jgi:hypothetical protein
VARSEWLTAQSVGHAQSSYTGPRHTEPSPTGHRGVRAVGGWLGQSVERLDSNDRPLIRHPS